MTMRTMVDDTLHCENCKNNTLYRPRPCSRDVRDPAVEPLHFVVLVLRQHARPRLPWPIQRQRTAQSVNEDACAQI